jgi:hypothetical protein
MVYLLTYDLRAPGKNYDSLYKALASYPDRYHSETLGSVWFIRGSYPLSAATIFDHIKQHIDTNDRLFVTAVTDNKGWMDQAFVSWFNLRQ